MSHQDRIAAAVVALLFVLVVGGMTWVARAEGTVSEAVSAGLR